MSSMPEAAVVPRRSVQVTGAVVAALAAVLIVVGTIMPSWWSAERGVVEQRIGLRQIELCAADECQSRDLEGLGSGSEAWPALGQLATLIGSLASLLLLVAAAGALLDRARTWPARLGRVAATVSLVALVVGAAFAWTYPGFGGLGAGPALIAYLGGAALGVGSAGILIGASGARRAP
jgi:hypothetical protein